MCYWLAGLKQQLAQNKAKQQPCIKGGTRVLYTTTHLDVFIAVESVHLVQQLQKNSLDFTVGYRTVMTRIKPAVVTN